LPISPFATNVIDEFLKLIPQKLFAYTRGEMKGLRPEWTSVTKDILREMAVARNLEQRSSHKAHGGEFLLDVAWFDRNSASMKLCVESEFNNGEKEFLRDSESCSISNAQQS
jgi:hypothetical protein